MLDNQAALNRVNREARARSVCILVRVLWPGGVQRIAIAQAEGLAKLGFDVELVFLRSSKIQTPYTIKNRHVIFAESVKCKRFHGIVKILESFTYKMKPQRGPDATVDLDLLFCFEVHRKNYDFIIYFDQWTNVFSWVGRIIHGGKTLVMIHETALKGEKFIYRLLERIALLSYDNLFTNSAVNQKILLSHGFSPVKVLYPGLHPISDRIPFDQRENIAISVTMWDFERRPEILLQIGKKLKHGKLVLVGSWTDQTYMNRITQQIKDDNIESKVLVTGPIDEDTLRKYYLSSKVFVRFGYNEMGPGMGSLEALSFALPLVINKGIGINEVIKSGENAIVVSDVEESDDNANEIDDLFLDEKKWTYMSISNKILADKLSWRNHIGELASVLNSSDFE